MLTVILWKGSILFLPFSLQQLHLFLCLVPYTQWQTVKNKKAHIIKIKGGWLVKPVWHWVVSKSNTVLAGTQSQGSGGAGGKGRGVGGMGGLA